MEKEVMSLDKLTVKSHKSCHGQQDMQRIWMPSPASTDGPIIGTGKVLVNYQDVDYRAFVFVVHEEHGMLLLHCTRKIEKGPHFQTPGGHVDAHEFVEAASKHSDRATQLFAACRNAAARELYEETGIDIRNQLDRLEPADLNDGNDPNGALKNEYKHRLFFYFWVNDDDFLKIKEGTMNPMGTEGKHLKIKFSLEHTGFLFQPEPTEAVKLLTKHSGGKVSEALNMAMIRSLGAEMKEKREQSLREMDPTYIREEKGPDDHAHGKNIDYNIPPKRGKRGIFCCFKL